MGLAAKEAATPVDPEAVAKVEEAMDESAMMGAPPAWKP
jgi:hypothetical protein